MLYRFSAALCVAALTLAFAGPAAAFDCLVAKKPPQAGAFGVVDLTTEQFTPSKKNPETFEQAHGGFVAVSEGRAARRRS